MSQEVAGSSRASSIEYIYPYRWVDSDSPDGAALLEKVPENARALRPGMVLPDGSTLARPTNVKLARRLGIASEPSLAPS